MNIETLVFFQLNIKKLVLGILAHKSQAIGHMEK